MSEFDGLLLDESHDSMIIDADSVEETIIELCQEFTEEEIGVNDFILGLKVLVTKGVELSHLSLTGRLDESQMFLTDIE